VYYLAFPFLILSFLAECLGQAEQSTSESPRCLPRFCGTLSAGFGWRSCGEKYKNLVTGRARQPLSRKGLGKYHASAFLSLGTALISAFVAKSPLVVMARLGTDCPIRVASHPRSVFLPGVPRQLTLCSTKSVQSRSRIFSVCFTLVLSLPCLHSDPRNIVRTLPAWPAQVKCGHILHN